MLSKKVKDIQSKELVSSSLPASVSHLSSSKIAEPNMALCSAQSGVPRMGLASLVGGE